MLLENPFIQNKTRIKDYYVSLLYSVLLLYCSLSSEIFYVTFIMKTFGCAVYFLWPTAGMSSICMNVTHRMVANGGIDL